MKNSKDEKPKDMQQYWRSNLRIVAVLLCVWFVVAFCISIFFIEPLNNFSVGELGLGFWFAQQGSIFIFVLLVFAYAILMDRLDRKFDVDE